jgi:predicted KAP-like P-loop ATPase
MIKYLILILININPIFGGKYLSTLFIVTEKLNVFTSMFLIISSESIVCAILFIFAEKLKDYKFFKNKLNKLDNNFVNKYGSYIGFFIGQLFLGAMFVSLILGLIEKKQRFNFYFPMITSIILYTILYYYLNLYSINFIKFL